jgi:hypothetical protein
MTRNLGRRFAVLVPLGCLIVWTLSTRSPATAQSGARSGVGEWRSYGADLANTRYSPLDQVNAANFKNLEVAWRFKTDNLGPRPEFNLQSTPLVANGVLYTTAGTRRAVVALDAGTGEMKWVFSLDEGKRGEAAPRLPTRLPLTDVKRTHYFRHPGIDDRLSAATGVTHFGKRIVTALEDDWVGSLTARWASAAGRQRRRWRRHLGGVPKSRRNERLRSRIDARGRLDLRSHSPANSATTRG